MAILTSQRKRQRNLIIVFIAVVVITLGVLYFGVLKQGGEPEVLEGDATVLRNIREVRLNLQLLKDKQFRDLVPYDKLRTGIKTGRKNPFTPYSIDNATSTNP